MRRAIARGRILPQSLSTDPRMGELSLKAALLFPLIWVNCDDQGRISGNPNEVKYTTCPNIDHISKADIPGLLKELDREGLIKVYTTSKAEAIQMLDWWTVQRLQWAWPSDYPPPEGWQDRLRYKKSAREVVTQNWGSPENPPENSPENSPEDSISSPLTTPYEDEKEKRRRRGRGRGNSPELSPESSGERPSPSPVASQKEILEKLFHCHEKGWAVLRVD